MSKVDAFDRRWRYTFHFSQEVTVGCPRKYELRLEPFTNHAKVSLTPETRWPRSMAPDHIITSESGNEFKFNLSDGVISWFHCPMTSGKFHNSPRRETPFPELHAPCVVFCDLDYSGAPLLRKGRFLAEGERDRISVQVFGSAVITTNSKNRQ